MTRPRIESKSPGSLANTQSIMLMGRYIYICVCVCVCVCKQNFGESAQYQCTDIYSVLNHLWLPHYNQLVQSGGTVDYTDYILQSDKTPRTNVMDTT